MEFRGWLFDKYWKRFLVLYITMGIGVLFSVTQRIQEISFKLSLSLFLIMLVMCVSVVLLSYFTARWIILSRYGKHKLIYKETFTIKKESNKLLISSSTKKISIALSDIKYIWLKLNIKGIPSFTIKTNEEKYFFNSIETDLQEIKSYLDNCTKKHLTAVCVNKQSKHDSTASSYYYHNESISVKDIRLSYIFRNGMLIVGSITCFILLCGAMFYYFIQDAKQEEIYNTNRFPTEVKNYLWGTRQVDNSKMKPLMESNDMFMLYTDNKSLYYYAFHKQQFYHRADIANLQPYNGSLFSDGEVLFFTSQRWIKGGRGRSGGSMGNEMTIYKSEIQIDELTDIYSDEYITLYQYKDSHFLHIKQVYDRLDSPHLFEIEDIESAMKIIKSNRTHNTKEFGLKSVAEVEVLLRIREKF